MSVYDLGVYFGGDIESAKYLGELEFGEQCP
jgi:hypothetical protein